MCILPDIFLCRNTATDCLTQKHIHTRNSLAVWWLGLWASTAGGLGWIPGWETKILQATQCGQINKKRLRQWQPTPVLLPRKSHEQRSLVGCSPWGLKESDTTEQLHFHFSLSCTGEGNGSPLQCSCLENPRDGGAW